MASTVRVIFKTPPTKYFAGGVLNIMHTATTTARKNIRQKSDTGTRFAETDSSVSYQHPHKRNYDAPNTVITMKSAALSNFTLPQKCSSEHCKTGAKHRWNYIKFNGSNKKNKIFCFVSIEMPNFVALLQQIADNSSISLQL